MRLRQTRNDLSNETRQQMAALLNQSLADSMDLYTQLKQAHWNVTGMDFIQLHKLYDDLAAIVLGHVDLIAERVTALGGAAQGTVRMAAENTQLQEFAAALGDGKEFTELLSDRFGAHGQTLRRNIDAADEAGDKDTADLFTEVSREIDKGLWFLEAHLR